MRDNLRLYHTILTRVCKWFPNERITRKRNLAPPLTGLYLGAAVHLSKSVRKWPIPGKLPSLVNRFRRFLDNPRVSVRAFYRPVAEQLVQALSGQTIRLIKVFRSMPISAQITHKGSGSFWMRFSDNDG